MTPARQLLDELHRHGAVAFRVGDRVRIRPADVVPADLLDRLRRHRDEVLALLADSPADAVPVADPAAAWRVMVDACEPVAGPVMVGPATITDPATCIAHDLADLERAVAHRNAGKDTFFSRLTEEYLTRLAACGCRVRVEVVQ